MEPAIPERLDFSFGYDDPNYSDKTLLLEIVDNAESAHTLYLKRRRSDDDFVIVANTEPRVKTIRITSLILAAISPVFRKLFSNGMRESEQKHTTLQIEASEEVSFMNLLNYVYNSKNLPTTPYSLLDLLLMADKFEVSSCMRDSARSLQNLPMTHELASLYFDLPTSMLTSPIIQPLIDAANKFVVARSKNFEQFKEMVLNLPLSNIRAVLSSDDLQVNSECVVYDLALAWAKNHYSNLEERRQVLETHLLPLVRFRYMSIAKLIELLNCRDIDPRVASRICMLALLFKSDHSYRKFFAGNSNLRIGKRAYKYRPVKVIELESPHDQCIVYLDLTREELKQIFPNGRIISESFNLGEQRFVLIAECYMVEKTSLHIFKMVLQSAESASCTVKYEIASRIRNDEEFWIWARGNRAFTETERLNFLHSFEWSMFINEGNTHFINDVLHLRLDLNRV